MSADVIRSEPLWTEEEQRALAGHARLHDMGLCVCPCSGALTKLLASLPERDRAVAVQATLDAFLTLAANGE